MQPNSPNRPVMDVTPSNNQVPAHSQPQPEPKPEVHNSPEQSSQSHSAEHQDNTPEQVQATEQPTPEPEDHESNNPEQEQPQPSKPKSTVPAGVISVTVFIMFSLIALAVFAYLASQ